MAQTRHSQFRCLTKGGAGAKTYLVGEGASPQAPAEHGTVLGKNRTLASSWRRSARTAAYTYSRAQTEGEMHHIW